MHMEWQTVKILIRLSSRSNQIWVCTVCSGLPVRKFRIITVISIFCGSKTAKQTLPAGTYVFSVQLVLPQGLYSSGNGVQPVTGDATEEPVARVVDPKNSYTALRCRHFRFVFLCRYWVRIPGCFVGLIR